MFENFISNLLTSYLGKYIGNLSNIKINLWSGNVHLQNLKIKKSAIREFGLPISIKDGIIGSLHITIPWTKLRSESIKISISDLVIVLHPKSAAGYNEEEEVEFQYELKREQLELFEAMRLQEEQESATMGQTSSSPPEPVYEEKDLSFISKLKSSLIGNIQLMINNVALVYEDVITDPLYSSNFTMRFDTLNVQTCDKGGNPLFSDLCSDKFIYKIIKLTGFRSTIDLSRSRSRFNQTFYIRNKGKNEKNEDFKSVIVGITCDDLINTTNSKKNIEKNEKNNEINNCADNTKEIVNADGIVTEGIISTEKGQSSNGLKCIDIKKEKGDVNYVISPIDLSIQLAHQPLQYYQNIPRWLVSVLVKEVNLQIDRSQWDCIWRSIRYIERFDDIKAFLKFRPTNDEVNQDSSSSVVSTPKTDPRHWWRYAIQSVLYLVHKERTKNSFDWDLYITRKKMQQEYLELHKRKQNLEWLLPITPEEEERYAHLEKELPLEMIKVARKLCYAKIKIEAEQHRVKVEYAEKLNREYEEKRAKAQQKFSSTSSVGSSGAVGKWLDGDNTIDYNTGTNKSVSKNLAVKKGWLGWILGAAIKQRDVLDACREEGTIETLFEKTSSPTEDGSQEIEEKREDEEFAEDDHNPGDEGVKYNTQDEEKLGKGKRTEKKNDGKRLSVPPSSAAHQIEDIIFAEKWTAEQRKILANEFGLDWDEDEGDDVPVEDIASVSGDDYNDFSGTEYGKIGGFFNSPLNTLEDKNVKNFDKNDKSERSKTLSNDDNIALPPQTANRSLPTVSVVFNLRSCTLRMNDYIGKCFTLFSLEKVTASYNASPSTFISFLKIGNMNISDPRSGVYGTKPIITAAPDRLESATVRNPSNTSHDNTNREEGPSCASSTLTSVSVEKAANWDKIVKNDESVTNKADNVRRLVMVQFCMLDPSLNDGLQYRIYLEMEPLDLCISVPWLQQCLSFWNVKSQYEVRSMAASSSKTASESHSNESEDSEKISKGLKKDNKIFSTDKTSSSSFRCKKMSQVPLFIQLMMKLELRRLIHFYGNIHSLHIKIPEACKHRILHGEEDLDEQEHPRQSTSFRKSSIDEQEVSVNSSNNDGEDNFSTNKNKHNRLSNSFKQSLHQECCIKIPLLSFTNDPLFDIKRLTFLQRVKAQLVQRKVSFYNFPTYPTGVDTSHYVRSARILLKDIHVTCSYNELFPTHPYCHHRDNKSDQKNSEERQLDEVSYRKTAYVKHHDIMTPNTIVIKLKSSLVSANLEIPILSLDVEFKEVLSLEGSRKMWLVLLNAVTLMSEFLNNPDGRGNKLVEEGKLYRNEEAGDTFQVRMAGPHSRFEIENTSDFNKVGCDRVKSPSADTGEEMPSSTGSSSSSSLHNSPAVKSCATTFDNVRLTSDNLDSDDYRAKGEDSTLVPTSSDFTTEERYVEMSSGSLVAFYSERPSMPFVQVELKHGAYFILKKPASRGKVKSSMLKDDVFGDKINNKPPSTFKDSFGLILFVHNGGASHTNRKGLHEAMELLSEKYNIPIISDSLPQQKEAIEFVLDFLITNNKITEEEFFEIEKCYEIIHNSFHTNPCKALSFYFTTEMERSRFIASIHRHATAEGFPRLLKKDSAFGDREKKRDENDNPLQLVTQNQHTVHISSNFPGIRLGIVELSDAVFEHVDDFDNIALKREENEDLVKKSKLNQRKFNRTSLISPRIVLLESEEHINLTFYLTLFKKIIKIMTNSIVLSGSNSCNGDNSLSRCRGKILDLFSSSEYNTTPIFSLSSEVLKKISRYLLSSTQSRNKDVPKSSSFFDSKKLYTKDNNYNENENRVKSLVSSQASPLRLDADNVEHLSQSPEISIKSVHNHNNDSIKQNFDACEDTEPSTFRKNSYEYKLAHFYQRHNSKRVTVSIENLEDNDFKDTFSPENTVYISEILQRITEKYSSKNDLSENNNLNLMQQESIPSDFDSIKDSVFISPLLKIHEGYYVNDTNDAENIDNNQDHRGGFAIFDDNCNQKYVKDCCLLTFISSWLPKVTPILRLSTNNDMSMVLDDSMAQSVELLWDLMETLTMQNLRLTTLYATQFVPNENIKLISGYSEFASLNVNPLFYSKITRNKNTCQQRQQVLISSTIGIANDFFNNPYNPDSLIDSAVIDLDFKGKIVLECYQDYSSLLEPKKAVKTLFSSNPEQKCSFSCRNSINNCEGHKKNFALNFSLDEMCKVQPFLIFVSDGLMLRYRSSEAMNETKIMACAPALLVNNQISISNRDKKVIKDNNSNFTTFNNNIDDRSNNNNNYDIVKPFFSLFLSPKGQILPKNSLKKKKTYLGNTLNGKGDYDLNIFDSLLMKSNKGLLTFDYRIEQKPPNIPLHQWIMHSPSSNWSYKENASPSGQGSFKMNIANKDINYMNFSNKNINSSGYYYSHFMTIVIDNVKLNYSHHVFWSLLEYFTNGYVLRCSCITSRPPLLLSSNLEKHDSKYKEYLKTMQRGKEMLEKSFFDSNKSKYIHNNKKFSLLHQHVEIINTDAALPYNDEGDVNILAHFDSLSYWTEVLRRKETYYHPFINNISPLSENLYKNVQSFIFSPIGSVILHVSKMKFENIRLWVFSDPCLSFYEKQNEYLIHQEKTNNSIYTKDPSNNYFDSFLNQSLSNMQKSSQNEDSDSNSSRSTNYSNYRPSNINYSQRSDNISDVIDSCLSLFPPDFSTDLLLLIFPYLPMNKEGIEYKKFSSQLNNCRRYDKKMSLKRKDCKKKIKEVIAGFGINFDLYSELSNPLKLAAENTFKYDFDELIFQGSTKQLAAIFDWSCFSFMEPWKSIYHPKMKFLPGIEPWTDWFNKQIETSFSFKERLQFSSLLRNDNSGSNTSISSSPSLSKVDPNFPIFHQKQNPVILHDWNISAQRICLHLCDPEVKIQTCLSVDKAFIQNNSSQETTPNAKITLTAYQPSQSPRSESKYTNDNVISNNHTVNTRLAPVTVRNPIDIALDFANGLRACLQWCADLSFRSRYSATSLSGWDLSKSHLKKNANGDSTFTNSIREVVPIKRRFFKIEPNDYVDKSINEKDNFDSYNAEEEKAPLPLFPELNYLSPDNLSDINNMCRDNNGYKKFNPKQSAFDIIYGWTSGADGEKYIYNFLEVGFISLQIVPRFFIDIRDSLLSCTIRNSLSSLLKWPLYVIGEQQLNPGIHNPSSTQTEQLFNYEYRTKIMSICITLIEDPRAKRDVPLFFVTFDKVAFYHLSTVYDNGVKYIFALKDISSNGIVIDDRRIFPIITPQHDNSKLRANLITLKCDTETGLSGDIGCLWFISPIKDKLFQLYSCVTNPIMMEMTWLNTYVEERGFGMPYKDFSNLAEEDSDKDSSLFFGIANKINILIHNPCLVIAEHATLELKEKKGIIVNFGLIEITNTHIDKKISDEIDEINTRNKSNNRDKINVVGVKDRDEFAPEDINSNENHPVEELEFQSTLLTNSIGNLENSKNNFYETYNKLEKISKNNVSLNDNLEKILLQTDIKIPQEGNDEKDLKRKEKKRNLGEGILYQFRFMRANIVSLHLKEHFLLRPTDVFCDVAFFDSKNYVISDVKTTEINADISSSHYEWMLESAVRHLISDENYILSEKRATSSMASKDPFMGTKIHSSHLFSDQVNDSESKGSQQYTPGISVYVWSQRKRMLLRRPLILLRNAGHNYIYKKSVNNERNNSSRKNNEKDDGHSNFSKFPLTNLYVNLAWDSFRVRIFSDKMAVYTNIEKMKLAYLSRKPILPLGTSLNEFVPLSKSEELHFPDENEAIRDISIKNCHNSDIVVNDGKVGKENQGNRSTGNGIFQEYFGSIDEHVSLFIPPSVTNVSAQLSGIEVGMEQHKPFVTMKASSEHDLVNVVVTRYDYDLYGKFDVGTSKVELEHKALTQSIGFLYEPYHRIVVPRWYLPTVLEVSDDIKLSERLILCKRRAIHFKSSVYNYITVNCNKFDVHFIEAPKPIIILDQGLTVKFTNGYLHLYDTPIECFSTRANGSYIVISDDCKIVPVKDEQAHIPDTNVFSPTDSGEDNVEPGNNKVDTFENDKSLALLTNDHDEITETSPNAGEVTISNFCSPESSFSNIKNNNVFYSALLRSLQPTSIEFYVLGSFSFILPGSSPNNNNSLSTTSSKDIIFDTCVHMNYLKRGIPLIIPKELRHFEELNLQSIFRKSVNETFTSPVSNKRNSSIDYEDIDQKVCTTFFHFRNFIKEEIMEEGFIDFNKIEARCKYYLTSSSNSLTNNDFNTSCGQKISEQRSDYSSLISSWKFTIKLGGLSKLTDDVQRSKNGSSITNYFKILKAFTNETSQFNLSKLEKEKKVCSDKSDPPFSTQIFTPPSQIMLTPFARNIFVVAEKDVEIRIRYGDIKLVKYVMDSCKVSFSHIENQFSNANDSLEYELIDNSKQNKELSVWHPSLMNIYLKLPLISFFLVDDTYWSQMDLPLLNIIFAEIQSPTFQIYSDIGYKINLKFLLKIDYYNLHSGAWSSFLEKVLVDVALRENKTSDKRLKKSSQTERKRIVAASSITKAGVHVRNMHFHLTPMFASVIARMMSLKTQFEDYAGYNLVRGKTFRNRDNPIRTEMVNNALTINLSPSQPKSAKGKVDEKGTEKDKESSTSGTFYSYSVTQQLGVTLFISFTDDADKRFPDKRKLENKEVFHFNFPRIDGREFPQSQHCIIIRTHEHIAIVNVARVGVTHVPLRVGANVQHVISDISVIEGRKHVLLRTNVAFFNTLSFPIILAGVGPVQKNERLIVPIDALRKRCLFLPSFEFKSQDISMGVFYEYLTNFYGQKFLCRAQICDSTTQRESYFILNFSPLKLIPGGNNLIDIQGTFEAPFKITNNTGQPVDIGLYYKQSNSETNSIGKIKSLFSRNDFHYPHVATIHIPSEKDYHVTEVNPMVDVFMSVVVHQPTGEVLTRVAGSKRRSLEPALIRSKHLADRVTVVKVLDAKEEELVICIEYNKNEVILYCPFWIVNQTTHFLRLVAKSPNKRQGILTAGLSGDGLSPGTHTPLLINTSKMAKEPEGAKLFVRVGRSVEDADKSYGLRWSQWSPAVPIYPITDMGVIDCGEGTECVTLSYSVSFVGGALKDTRVIKITPRWIVINHCGQPLFLQQNSRLGTSFLQPEHCAVLDNRVNGHPNLLQIKHGAEKEVSGGVTMVTTSSRWTPFVSIDKLGDHDLNVRYSTTRQPPQPGEISSFPEESPVAKVARDKKPSKTTQSKDGNGSVRGNSQLAVVDNGKKPIIVEHNFSYVIHVSCYSRGSTFYINIDKPVRPPILIENRTKYLIHICQRNTVDHITVHQRRTIGFVWDDNSAPPVLSLWVTDSAAAPGTTTTTTSSSTSSSSGSSSNNNNTGSSHLSTIGGGSSSSFSPPPQSSFTSPSVNINLDPAMVAHRSSHQLSSEIKLPGRDAVAYVRVRSFMSSYAISVTRDGLIDRVRMTRPFPQFNYQIKIDTLNALIADTEGDDIMLVTVGTEGGINAMVSQERVRKGTGGEPLPRQVVPVAGGSPAGATGRTGYYASLDDEDEQVLLVSVGLIQVVDERANSKQQVVLQTLDNRLSTLRIVRRIQHVTPMILLSVVELVPQPAKVHFEDGFLFIGIKLFENFSAAAGHETKRHKSSEFPVIPWHLELSKPPTSQDNVQNRMTYIEHLLIGQISVSISLYRGRGGGEDLMRERLGIISILIRSVNDARFEWQRIDYNNIYDKLWLLCTFMINYYKSELRQQMLNLVHVAGLDAMRGFVTDLLEGYFTSSSSSRYTNRFAVLMPRRDKTSFTEATNDTSAEKLFNIISSYKETPSAAALTEKPTTSLSNSGNSCDFRGFTDTSESSGKKDLHKIKSGGVAVGSGSGGPRQFPQSDVKNVLIPRKGNNSGEDSLTGGVVQKGSFTNNSLIPSKKTVYCNRLLLGKTKRTVSIEEYAAITSWSEFCANVNPREMRQYGHLALRHLLRTRKIDEFVRPSVCKHCYEVEQLRKSRFFSDCISPLPHPSMGTIEWCEFAHHCTWDEFTAICSDEEIVQYSELVKDSIIGVPYNVDRIDPEIESIIMQCPMNKKDNGININAKVGEATPASNEANSATV